MAINTTHTPLINSAHTHVIDVLPQSLIEGPVLTIGVTNVSLSTHFNGAISAYKHALSAASAPTTRAKERSGTDTYEGS